MSETKVGMIPSDGTQTNPGSIQNKKTASNPPSKSNPNPSNLPKLPIPNLNDSCQRYLRALEGLQDEEEHSRTKMVVKDFLESGEGEKWQAKLEEYDKGVDSYIEEFWCKFLSLGDLLFCLGLGEDRI